MLVRFRYMGIPLRFLDNKDYEIELNENADVEDLVNTISEVYAVDLNYLKKSTFIVNNTMAAMNSQLSEGSRITIIKVLGGG